MSNRLKQTRSPADAAVKPVAEIPDLVMRGANRSIPLRPSPQDNIMRFWQAGRNDGVTNRDDSLTVEPAHEVEVSHRYTIYAQASVYLHVHCTHILNGC